MSHDQQTYARAANTALIGLVTQIILTLAVGLLSLAAQAEALVAATYHLAAGIPLWFVLWLIFNQHRLERVEALEAQQLAEDDAQAAALFQEAGDQLALARRRLDRLYKVGQKLVGLTVALYLLGHGGTLLYLNASAVRAGDVADLTYNPTFPVALIGIIASVGGLVAFLLGRYIAGMTQFDAWSALRAGASYLMGHVLVFAGVLVALLVQLVSGSTDGFAYLAVLVPFIMVVLGAEIFLSYILSLYRPIAKGEYPRPIFDSRLLSFLTQPQSFGRIVSETINYQFGFEISRSWFYRLIARATLPLILLCVAVVIGMSSVVIVQPHQQATVTTFGNLDRMIGPGLHFKAPWPVGRIERYDVQRVQQVFIGSRPGASAPITGVAVLWTNPHTLDGVKEVFLITAPTADGLVDGAATGGELIGGDVAVQYRIDDLMAYVTSAVEPELLLHALGERVVSAAFRERDIDELLSIERPVFGAKLKKAIQDEADAAGLGVHVVSVAVSALHPPQDAEVADSFHEQVRAQQEAEATIENAKKDALSTLAGVAGSAQQADAFFEAITELDAQATGEARVAQEAAIDAQLRAAGGEAAQRLLEASATRWRQAVTEQARAQRFGSELLAYQKAPRYYRARLYLETLANAAAERRKIILSTGDVPPVVRVDLEQAGTGVEGIFGTDN